MLTYSTGVANAGAIEQITEQEFANRVQTYDETQLQSLLQSVGSDEIEVLVSDPIEDESWYVIVLKNVTDPEGNAVEGATVTITNPDDNWELYMKAAVPAGSSWETDSATSVYRREWILLLLYDVGWRFAISKQNNRCRCR